MHPHARPILGPRLEERFADKQPLLTSTQAREESSRCLYCHDAPCIRSCPTAIDIPTFIRKIHTGNLRGAARTILEANLLGASCARVCPVEVLCESTCVYTHDERPAIAIGRLQRYAMAHGAAPDLLAKAPPTGCSVGLVGAGPASLACAGALVRAGHRAVVYERGTYPGGLNTHGVAPYKLKVDDALAEVAFLEALGVEIRTQTEIGKTVTADALLRAHDAVFLGPGLGPDTRLGVPGAAGPGVVGAVEWIERVKTDPGYALEGATRAVVIGGGNTALDAARELRGLGLQAVVLVYRRTAAAMSGYAHELAAALREGAVLVEQAAVAEVLREGQRVTGVRLVETEEGRPTTRPRGVIPCDLVVAAIGQSKLRELVALFPGVRLDARGCIAVDPTTFATDNPRVFAGGDAVSGGQEVVNAVAEGQRAARSIDALLRAKAPPHA